MLLAQAWHIRSEMGAEREALPCDKNPCPSELKLSAFILPPPSFLPLEYSRMR